MLFSLLGNYNFTTFLKMLNTQRFLADAGSVRRIKKRMLPKTWPPIVFSILPMRVFFLAACRTRSGGRKYPNRPTWFYVGLLFSPSNAGGGGPKFANPLVPYKFTSFLSSGPLPVCESVGESTHDTSNGRHDPQKVNQPMPFFCGGLGVGGEGRQ